MRPHFSGGGGERAAAGAAGWGALLALKRVTRAAVADLEAAKTEAEGARARADAARLALQSLIYERDHHAAEIEAARSFAGANADVSVVSEDEFFKLGGAAAAASHDDPHAFMLDRIAFERDERARLVERLAALGKRRAKLRAAAAATRRAEVALPSRLGELRAAAEALGGAIGADAAAGANAAFDEHSMELARLLPAPLYVAFRRFAALELSAPELGVRACVEGEANEGRAWAEERKRAAAAAEAVADARRSGKAARAAGAMDVAGAESPDGAGGGAPEGGTAPCPLSVLVSLAASDGAPALDLRLGFAPIRGGSAARSSHAGGIVTAACATPAADPRGDLLECLRLPGGMGRPINAPRVAGGHRWTMALGAQAALPYEPADRDMGDSDLDDDGLVGAKDVVRALRCRLRERGALEGTLAQLASGMLPAGMPAGVEMDKLEELDPRAAKSDADAAESTPGDDDRSAARHAREFSTRLSAGSLCVDVRVRVSVAYPVRAPHVRVRVSDTSGGDGLPPVPAGVADVTEAEAAEAAEVPPAEEDVNLVFELERAANVEALKALRAAGADGGEPLAAQLIALGGALSGAAARAAGQGAVRGRERAPAAR